MNGFWRSTSVFKKTPITTTAASQTDELVSVPNFHLTPQGAQRLRLDIYYGECTVTNEISAVIEHSTGYNNWEDGPSTTLSSNTDTANFTAATTDILTDTAHTLLDNEAVVVSNSGGALPGGLEANTIYYVDRINANTFYLTTNPGKRIEDRVDVTSTGSGTHSWTRLKKVSIIMNPEVTADQSYVPLGNQARVTLTTGTDDTAQIVDLRLLQDT